MVCIVPQHALIIICSDGVALLEIHRATMVFVLVRGVSGEFNRPSTESSVVQHSMLYMCVLYTNIREKYMLTNTHKCMRTKYIWDTDASIVTAISIFSNLAVLRRSTSDARHRAPPEM